MTERPQQKTELMYTPLCHIPIGEPVKTPDGTRAVKFKKPGGKDTEVVPIRHVLYNCSASRPSIESKTKEDTIEPGTETLSLTADPRSDGLVKSRTGDTTDKTAYDNWYKAVYVPDEEVA